MKQRGNTSPSVCWLDLANAFGSVHHNMIQFSFLTTMPLQHDQYGDPLSVLVFNTVMNTLVDTITKCHPDLGYQLSSSPIKSNLLQYADDTSLLAHGPSSCKALLATTEAWLKWSGMKANVPKCVSLAIRASSGTPYDPKLVLNGEQSHTLVTPHSAFSEPLYMSLFTTPTCKPGKVCLRN